ncbi:MAG: Rod shape-determining protein RodA [Candidatus Woesebacteria bacterium GW2011_GWB1_41_10]|uniref:Probable peptidoglycan glycosyltransferase FtsW n=1 Tax=Candidatus Woesebacteria bacterium GW2011_GWB1_41_10 TaxID=1618577 RepID=A0A0G0UHH6_9BACT|nr:MAG: Rod shape-determining protein RodA [Candidatus Woesebacteria bacterium GW2011_GWB1_41_10]
MFDFLRKDKLVVLATFFLVAIGVFSLTSVSPSLFPSYYIYILIGIVTFWFFSQIGYDVVSLFSKYFYIVSIFLLVLTLIIGQVTRGTIRWIPIGSLTFQPAELVRPFLLVFFADYLTNGELTLRRLLRAVGLLAFPAFLILIQPSFGVTILTLVGFLGILFASDFNKKHILTGSLIVLGFLPLLWLIMQPYQRARVTGFLKPESDPLGAGYNSIQSQIAVGSGKIMGRGLGKGVQTQLAFLPERSSDFIFASVAEETGFVGAILVVVGVFIILWRLTIFMENSVNQGARAFLSGFFLIYLVQVIVHIGMNLGLLPITGVPLPLVSAGGSSFLATMIGLGLALGAYKK